MYYIVFRYILLAVAFSSANAAAGSGRVFIGYNSEDLTRLGVTNPDVYVFSLNNGTLFVPLYVTTTDPTIIGNVNVTCEILPTENTELPFTNVNFGSGILNDAKRKFNLPVTSLLQTGRPVKFRCYGDSIGGTDKQFTPETSVSPVKDIQGVKPPTVSICDPAIVLPNLLTYSATTKYGFFVKLSEPVTTYNVTITCGPVNETAVPTSPIETQPYPVDVGSAVRYKIEYTIKSKTSPFEYGCRAQSDSPGTQYKTISSLGSTTTISVATGEVNFIPNRAQITASAFELSLVLDSPLDVSSSNVVFLCTVIRVKSDAEEEAAIQNYKCDASSNTTTNVTSTNTTGAWSVNERVIFQANKIAEVLTVRRSTVPTVAVIERLVVICCAQASNTEPKYENAKAVARITATFPNIVPVNTSGVATNVETAVPDPAFVNPAPCPCDLKPTVCDPGCCCDSKCNDADKQLSDCLSGYFGGNLSSIPPSTHACASAGKLGTDDYSQFMCIMYENNAIIGHYYRPTPVALQNQQQVTSKLNSLSTVNSPTSNPTRSPTESGAQQNRYLRGHALLLNTGAADPKAFTAGLTLPGDIGSGICSTDALVRFQMERTSACPIVVTSTTCQGSPVLSALSYAMASSLRQPACPEYTRILTGGPQGGDVTTTVDYFCVENLDSLKGVYLSGSTHSTSPPIETGPPNVNCYLQNDNETYLCNATGFGSGGQAVVAKRCSFDDGESLPPSPSFDTTSKVCSNVVVNVSYSFTWNATGLTELKVFVLLANITESMTLTQRFKVNFTHAGLANLNSSVERMHRSGVFGYDDQKPLIGGKRVNGSNSKVDSSSSYQPVMIKPGTDGLCGSTGTEPILFPYSAKASCFIYLNREDLSNCDLLRHKMKVYLDQLTPFDVVATYGDPSPTASSDWADLIVEDSILTRSNNTTTAVSNATSVNNTNASADNVNETVTQIKLTDLMLSGCNNIPTGISIKVIYSLQGKARDVPIYQVIGVYKQYIMSTVTLTCDATPNSPCVNTTRGRPFFIDVFYQFIQGPATWKTNIWAGISSFVTICWWDICMKDLLALWTSEVYVEIRPEVIGLTLVSALIIIPLLYSTWPWHGAR